jgi:hypothetical protein
MPPPPPLPLSPDIFAYIKLEIQRCPSINCQLFLYVAALRDMGQGACSRNRYVKSEIF